MTAIELRHLRAFVAVAGDLHLEQGAGRLELSQVDDLEGIVGAQLVDRRQRTVGLTGAGRELLPVARSVLRDIDAAVRHAREPETRAPVLGILGSSGHRILPDLQGELAIRGAPELQVGRLELADGFQPLAFGVDVGLYPLPLVPPAGLEFAVIGHSHASVALPGGHPLAGADAVPLSALLEQPVILPSADSVWWDDLRLLAQGHGRPLVTGPAAASLYEALMLVAAGHGWTPSAARADFPHWDDVVVRPLSEVEPIRIAAVWRHLTARSRLLVDALVASAR